MPKKEKVKFILNLILTPVIIVTMVIIALTMKDKPIIQEKNENGTQTEVLNVINHSHNF